MPEPGRQRDLSRLDIFNHSDAFARHHFVFTNTWEGWFFSAFEAQSWGRIVRGIGQLFEGSLFDWQIGDVYDVLNGCTAGDLRSRYYIADPEEISVIAEIKEGDRIASFTAVPYRGTSNHFSIGILSAGQHSPEDLFALESAIAHRACKLARCVNLLGGAAAVHLIMHFGQWRPCQIVAPAVGAAIGISLTLMSLVWAAVYGLSDFRGSDSDLWTILAGLAGVALVGVSLRYDAIFGVKTEPKKVD